MKQQLKRLRLFWSFLGCTNYYEGVDEVTLWDRIYVRRVGIRSAWELATKITFHD
jgi:hypothetical protein